MSIKCFYKLEYLFNNASQCSISDKFSKVVICNASMPLTGGKHTDGASRGAV